MKELLRKELLKYDKKTISIEGLEAMLSDPSIPYKEFANLILSFEKEGILETIKLKGRNSRNPSLPYQFRIQKQFLKEDVHNDIKKKRLLLHPSIQLDSYFGLNPTQWQNDLPYLLLIDKYIRTSGLPNYEVPAPERSVELVGDEKWIIDRNGKELLERVGLWSAMRVIPVSDPLMFAVNPSRVFNQNQKHLIVENKTTFQALLDVLQETNFSTLIYGSGNKIIKSIEQFERQLPTKAITHMFFYFGDLDRSGMFIWHRLNQKVKVHLAMPFYHACMKKVALKGKMKQRYDDAAVNDFLSCFDKEKERQLRVLLENGEYYPQEILRTRELQDIWRNGPWN